MKITWLLIALVVLESTAGDILISRAMKQIGDLHALLARIGLVRVIGRVLTDRTFLSGIFFMALAFFSLLAALSWANVSVVGPATTSLTFITDAFAAQIFLKERVDRRRWAAALFVAGGVALLV
ncbi:MAG: EamA family transporter [Terriglobales bacterium]|jgi:drug/metabolite transporter (DMT)-like permease